MERFFFSMLAVVLQSSRPRYNAQLQLMAAQIRILRSRVDASRICTNSEGENGNCFVREGSAIKAWHIHRGLTSACTATWYRET